MKFIVEENSKHFLNTAFKQRDRKFNTRVYKKPGKLNIHCKSATQKGKKRNTNTGVLLRAKRISTNWDEEINQLNTHLVMECCVGV